MDSNDDPTQTFYLDSFVTAFLFQSFHIKIVSCIFFIKFFLVVSDENVPLISPFHSISSNIGESVSHAMMGDIGKTWYNYDCRHGKDPKLSCFARSPSAGWEHVCCIDRFEQLFCSNVFFLVWTSCFALLSLFAIHDTIFVFQELIFALTKISLFYLFRFVFVSFPCLQLHSQTTAHVFGHCANSMC